MKRFIPYEKLSKKKKKELDRLNRADWGSIDPRTRKPEDPKAYNRKKAQTWNQDDFPSVPYLMDLSILSMS